MVERRPRTAAACVLTIEADVCVWISGHALAPLQFFDSVFEPLNAELRGFVDRNTEILHALWAS